MDYIRIAYDEPKDNELTPADREARARLQAAISSAIDTFHEESRDGLIEIELWPDHSVVAV